MSFKEDKNGISGDSKHRSESVNDGPRKCGQLGKSEDVTKLNSESKHLAHDVMCKVFAGPSVSINTNWLLTDKL